MLNSRALIDIQGVSKQFRSGGQKTTVINDISLIINANEFLAIVGPSGSGKTTLAHLIGGLITPTKGFVRYGDMPARLNDSRLSRYRNNKVGFVFQNFSLIPHYTACENVALPLVVAGVSSRERKRHANELLKSMNLEARCNARADTLSGGERQRVAIARALIMKPDIIIADEPTGSLDSVHGDEVIAILKHLHKAEGLTILMVTHDQAIARQANRVIHILDGKIEKEVVNENA